MALIPFLGEEMIRYMIQFLGPIAKANFEEWQKTFPNDLKQMADLGPNPYNFVNTIQLILTGRNPNTGDILIQTEAARKLEQVHLYSWHNIKPFMQEYYYFVITIDKPKRKNKTQDNLKFLVYDKSQ